MGSRPLKMGPRNDPAGLARRSLENLRVIEQAFVERKRGHVVTQLVQTLLGVIIFPKERELLDQFRKWRLDDLREDRWPSLKPVKDDEQDTHTLYDVIRHMRNALCHGGVKFYGEGLDGADSRHVEEITIEFSDRNDRYAPIDWQLRLSGPDLWKFCELIEHIVYL